MRVRGFWSQSTSRVREEIEPVRLAAKRLRISVLSSALKKDLGRMQNLSRNERVALRTRLIRANQTHSRLLFQVRSWMRKIV